MLSSFSHSKFFVFFAALCCALIVLPDLYGQSASDEVFKNFQYRSIGPTRQSGRFVDFAVPVQEPYTFYAATGSGHLWKTVNNGQTFEPLFENENVFSIGDIAVAPSNPKILWLGSGEANNSRSTYWGDGVYKSTDAGKTWTNMGLKESHHIGRIVIDPANPDVVYVAALGHLYSENPERGLYKTTNGGKTWEKVLGPVVKEKNIGVVDVAMDPGNSSVLYAATYDKVRKPHSFNLGGPGSRLYKTTDAGKTWKMLEGGLPGGMLGRIGISIYLRNPNIVYVCIENANKPGMPEEERYKELLEDKASRGMIDGEIYRSDDAGATWKKASPDDQSIGGGPGYYYGQIIIDPNDDKVVYVLSASSYVTRDGGQNWQSRAFSGIGGDDHALWIDPEDSNHMLLGYDHGLGVTFDGGQFWYHPDNLSLAQFYAVGYDMSYPYNVAGGLQDNGSHMAPSTSRRGMIRLEDWKSVGGGDGMYNVFDTVTNRYLYNESQFGPLSRVDLKTGERKSIAYSRVDRDMRWNWNAPILVSPHNSDVIYHAGNKLLKSPFRGESWVVISPDLTTNDPSKMAATGKGGDGNIQYCTITTIDESTLVEGLLWVGTDDGNVQVTKDGGQTWTLCNDKITGNPGYWVSRVIASHFEPGTAYVTYTGFRRDDFRPFVYKTTDFGESWTSIANNLPAEPINVIREHHKNPNLLFVGTDFAVCVSIDGGKSWTKMKNNMPTQPVQDLAIHPRENDLIVATHGRGIYITDISPLAEMTSEVMTKDVFMFDIESKIRWVNNVMNASSSSNFSGESEPMTIPVYYYLKSKPVAAPKLTIYQGNVMVSEYTGTADPGMNVIHWDMTKKPQRTAEEMARIEEQAQRARQMGFGRGRSMDPPAPLGEYRFVLTVNGKTFTKYASILQDLWFDK